MPLQKQPVAINFAQGLDTKSDPWQIPIGKFYNLVNSVFTKTGLLKKRDGFGTLFTPTNPSTYLTTLNGALLAVGDYIEAWSPTTPTAPYIQPRYNVQLATLSVYKSSATSTFSDSVTSSSGLTFSIYNNVFNGNNNMQASITDATTGQTVRDTIGFLAAAIDRGGALITYPRVFDLGNYFIVCFTQVGGGAIKYTAINKTTLAVPAAVTLTTSGTTTNVSVFDGVVFNNVLYLAYQDAANGTSLITLSDTLVIGTPVVLDAARAPVAASVTPDATNGNIWVSYVDIALGKIWATAVTTPGLVQIVAPTQVLTEVLGTANTLTNITSLATAGVATIYVTIPLTYPNIGTPYGNIKTNTITNVGVVGTEHFLVRSLSLASKAFFVDGVQYVMGLYISDENRGDTVVSSSQNTLFLIRNTNQTIQIRNIVARLAYSNAFNFYLFGLPSASLYNTDIYVSYLAADYGNPTNLGITFFNYGVNQVRYDFTDLLDSSVELSNNLSIGGGFLWNYDGQTSVENNFFLYPDNIFIASFGVGNLDPQEYFYQVIYTWVDVKGNRVQSSPSIPVFVTLATVPPLSGVLLQIPTMRISYKGGNPGIAIEIYRASTAQPTFYKITNDYIANSDTSATISYLDTFADADILGNEILYTTGGVIEDTGAPATSIMTLWDTRLWMVNSEDPNQLWFSKTAIEGVPIEMSDLQTYFVGQDISSQGPTDGVTSLAPLDDKLIVFTKNSLRYINGSGPDNTGSNNNYSQPIHVTSTVGCITHSSIALIPIGLIFQSDKGIWLLGRDLSTKYIGAPVENYTQFNVNSLTQPLIISTTVIPDSTQVRLVLDSGLILMYDYLYDQWGTFEGITAQSATLYNGLHTLLNQSNMIFQSTPGVYADGAAVVNMSFQTGWINFAGLQAYERSYYFYLLGQYASPHTLNIQIGYDYLTTIEQVSNIPPVQVAPPPVSTSNVEQWRVFLQRGKCQAFQLTISENDTTVGAGLTLSGLNMVIGKKKGYPVRRQNLSVG